MRKVTLEFSAPALQATLVCLATLVVSGGLIWAYVGETTANQRASQSEHGASGSQHEALVNAAFDSPAIEQPGTALHEERTDQAKDASARSSERGTHPKNLIGPLATNLVNLVGRLQQKSRHVDRGNPAAPTTRSVPTE